jgi:hypothetical protein
MLMFDCGGEEGSSAEYEGEEGDWTKVATF